MEKQEKILTLSSISMIDALMCVLQLCRCALCIATCELSSTRVTRTIPLTGSKDVARIDADADARSVATDAVEDCAYLT